MKPTSAIVLAACAACLFLHTTADTTLEPDTIANATACRTLKEGESAVDIFLDDWRLQLALVTAFCLAFAVGANDVANPFGTSVGSGALTIKQVFWCAAIFETLGALMLGGLVAKTLQKGIIVSSIFNGKENLFAIGEICAMLGAASWQIVATIFGLPVSSTHSIVGATVGFAMVEGGLAAVQWMKIGAIVLSWVTSPVCAGLLACSLYKFIIQKDILMNPLTRQAKTIAWLPIFYASVVGFNFYLIVRKGTGIYFPEMKKDENMMWYALAVAALLALMTYAFVRFVKLDGKFQNGHSWKSMARVSTADALDTKAFMQLSDKKKAKIDARQTACSEIQDGDGSEREDIHYLFSKLQAFAACFDAFAHGANDVGNSIGPVLACYTVISTGCMTGEPAGFGLAKFVIILYASVAIIIGLVTLGRRVIKTIGEDLTPLTPARGFSIDIMSGITVVLGSNFGIPLSTTHCKVGAVVAVGMTYKKDSLEWGVFKNILYAWIITVPASGGVAAVLYAIAKYFIV